MPERQDGSEEELRWSHCAVARSARESLDPGQPFSYNRKELAAVWMAAVEGLRCSTVLRFAKETPMERKSRIHALYRLAGLAGAAGPVISSITLFHSVRTAPWFSWQHNSLSDLGAGPAGYWFNLGLVIQGILSVITVVGVRKWLGEGLLAGGATLVMLMASAALALVGVVTKDGNWPHLVVAAAYFVLSPVALMMMACAMWRIGTRVLAALTASAGISALLAISCRPRTGFAVPEILAAQFISAWTFSMGINLLLGGPPNSCGARSESRAGWRAL